MDTEMRLILRLLIFCIEIVKNESSSDVPILASICVYGFNVSLSFCIFLPK